MPGPNPAAMKLALGGMLAMAAAMGIGRFIYTPILPLMVEDLHLSRSEAGLIASANFVGYLAGALLAAGLHAGAGARTWFLGALLASGVSTAAMYLPSDLLPMLVLRFVGGVASALVLVFSSALVLERLSAAGRGQLATIHFGGVGAGIAVSAAMVAVLVALGTGWRGEWLAGGALTLLLVPCVALLVPPQVAAPGAPSGIAAAPGGRSLAMVRVAISYGLFGFGYVITATFIVAIVRADPAIRAFEPVTWISVGLAAVPSVPLWGRAARRWGLARVYALACFAEAIGVALSVVVPSVLGALLAAVLLGGTFVAITALGLMTARELSPGNPRRSLGLMTAAFGVGQIIGPLAAGIAFDRLGSFTVPSLAAAAALFVGGLLTVGIRP